MQHVVTRISIPYFSVGRKKCGQHSYSV